MSRPRPIDPARAEGAVKEQLDRVEQFLGMIPNFIRVLGSSPAALQGYLGFARLMAEHSVLDPVLRAQVELRVSEFHECEYGVASYAAVAQAAGLSDQQVKDGRFGSAPDPRTQAAMDFCLELLKGRGQAPDAGFARLRRQGFDDGQLLELIALCALTWFTNTVNHAAGTELDFPAQRGVPPF